MSAWTHILEPKLHNEMADLFQEIREAMGESLSKILWATEPLAKKLEAAWCPEKPWAVKLVRFK